MLRVKTRKVAGVYPSRLPVCNTAKYTSIPAPCVLAAAVQATRTAPVLLVAVVIALAVVTANEMILAMAAYNSAKHTVRNKEETNGYGSNYAGV